MPRKQLHFSQDSKKSEESKEEKKDLSPFKRYKTESLKSNQKLSLKNIFNRLSVELKTQKNQ